MIELSVVVPCYIEHIKNINNIIGDNISNQTVRPDELIIVINPIITSYHNQMIKKVFDGAKKKYDFIKFVGVNTKCTPGKARNLGIQQSSGEIIIFSDADDRYHPMRNEVVSKIFKNHDCDAVMHGFSFKDLNFLNDNIDYESILVDGCKIDVDHQTNMKPKENNFEIHHGHGSFKKKLLEEIKYNENMVPGEDGEIFRRANSKNKKIICIDAKLSSWEPSGTWRN